MTGVFQALVDSMLSDESKREPPRVRTEHEQAIYLKDLEIARLTSRNRDLEQRLSNYGWAESARHAAMTGGTL